MTEEGQNDGGGRIIINVNEAASNSGQEFAQGIVFIIVPFPFVEVIGISFSQNGSTKPPVFRRRKS